MIVSETEAPGACVACRPIVFSGCNIWRSASSYPAVVFFLFVVLWHGAVVRLAIDWPLAAGSHHDQVMLSLRYIKFIVPT